MKPATFRLCLFAAACLAGAGSLLFYFFPTMRQWTTPSTLALQGAVVFLAWSFSFLKTPSFSEKAFTRVTPGSWNFPIILSLLLLVLLVWINQSILLKFMNSADEHSCFFLAQCLLRGKLWAVPHPLYQFFDTPHIGVMGNKWFSVYPPGWPLLWALGLKLGLKDVLNPLITALAFYLIFRRAHKIYGDIPALVAGSLCLVSPFFLSTGAAYFSHNTCLLFMAIFWECCYQWENSRKRVWPILAGLALSYGLATRYLTMAAFSLPIIFHMLKARPFSNRSNWNAWIRFTALLFGLQVFHLAFNYAITGNPINPPNHFLHSHEKLGFILSYTPLVALQYLGSRILYLIEWTPPLVVILFLLSLFYKKKPGWERTILYSTLMVPIAYCFYYSWGGNQFGPRYYFEVYPWIVLSAAAFLCSGNPSKIPGLSDQRLRRCIAVFMILGALPMLFVHFHWIHQMTSERKALYIEVETKIQKPALVFIHGFLGDTLVMSQEDAVRNQPFLDAPILFASDRGIENQKLKAFYKNRPVYCASYDRISKNAVLNPLTSEQYLCTVS